MSRTADIVADAAYAILIRPSRETTGNFFIDEEVLRAEGVSDFSKYAPGAEGRLAGDFLCPTRSLRAALPRSCGADSDKGGPAGGGEGRPGHCPARKRDGARNPGNHVR